MRPMEVLHGQADFVRRFDTDDVFRSVVRNSLSAAWTQTASGADRLVKACGDAFKMGVTRCESLAAARDASA